MPFYFAERHTVCMAIRLHNMSNQNVRSVHVRINSIRRQLLGLTSLQLEPLKTLDKIKRAAASSPNDVMLQRIYTDAVSDDVTALLPALMTPRQHLSKRHFFTDVIPRRWRAVL